MIDYTIITEGRSQLGEVPLWCERTQTLWWVDAMRCGLHGFEPATGRRHSVGVCGERLGSIALREDGGLLLATSEGIDTYDPNSATQSYFTGKSQLASGQCYNDGRCDRQGRFWVGSMNESITPGGSVYRVDADGSVTHCFGDVIVPNSIAFSPDSRFFYFADTRRFTIWRFDLDAASGAISNRTVFAQTSDRPGRPDGSCVDSEGFLWNAEYAGGQVVRYAPDGRIDRIVALPVTHPTSVCFGGPALDTLFVTSGRMHLTPETADSEPLAGAVLAIDPHVKGLPESRFSGPMTGV
jgi:sugar lactone lactonase YvrE